MRTRRLKKGLPFVWQRIRGMPRLEREFDVFIGKLAAKVLVFRSHRDLVRCWKTIMKVPLGAKNRTVAVVSPLSTVVKNSQGEFLEVDPRYFCVMGFISGQIGMEVVAHESVHAGFCHFTRTGGKLWREQMQDNEQEGIAYPSGLIARELNKQFHKHGVYELKGLP